MKLEIPAEKLLPDIEQFIKEQLKEVKISNKSLEVENIEWTEKGLTLTIKE